MKKYTESKLKNCRKRKKIVLALLLALAPPSMSFFFFLSSRIRRREEKKIYRISKSRGQKKKFFAISSPMIKMKFLSFYTTRSFSRCVHTSTQHFLISLTLDMEINYER